jgi:hypothetical protein|tara:strand:- start:1689 stop:1808 length:120 start_codon:yes stop_codon:yes gene_type:complete
MFDDLTKLCVIGNVILLLGRAANSNGSVLAAATTLLIKL